MLAPVTRALSRLAPPSSRRTALEDALPAAAGFGIVLGLSATSGGFFATTWGWWALSLLLVAGTALVVRQRPSLAPLQAGMVLALGALVAWTAFSALWSTSAGTPLLETERSTLYFAAVAAVLLLPGRPSPRPLAAGMLAGCVAVSAWSLAARLDVRGASGSDFESYRLAGPLGYSNGLALVAAIGSLVALGFLVHAARPAPRAAVAASLVVLVETLTLTFSRGSWLALIAGLVVLLALEPRRLERLPRLVAAVPCPALAVWAGMQSSALSRAGAPADEVTRQEHRLAFVLLGLIATAVVLALLADRLPAPPRPSRRTALSAAAVAAALVLAGAVVVVARAGGPDRSVHRALAAFRSDAGGTGSHVFSASGSSRSDYWSVAWRETTDHPLLGGGAGSFGAWWLRLRPIDFGTLDAHELYLETLAELGPIGLLLLCAALALPLAALRRARRAPLGAACGAAYVAFLLHAAVDWDWELPAAGLAGVLCGVALLRAEGRSLRLALPARVAAVGAAGALAAFVFVMHVGNVSLARSGSARDRDDLGAALREARRADRWQPWSAEPPLALGQAQLAAGDLDAASASFRRAVARDRADWEAWYQLGLATTGATRDRALEEAARLNPRSPELAELRG
jgi:hypothetical protein